MSNLKSIHLIPSFFQIFYSLGPKMEIFFKYFSDKDPQNHLLWTRLQGSAGGYTVQQWDRLLSLSQYSVPSESVVWRSALLRAWLAGRLQACTALHGGWVCTVRCLTVKGLEISLLFKEKNTEYFGNYLNCDIFYFLITLKKNKDRRVTQLMLHTVTHFTGPSFMLKDKNQPYKRF